MLEKDLVRQGDLDLLSGQCQWIEEKFGTRVTILVFQGAALARQTLDKNIIEDPVLLWPKTFELQNRFDQGEMLTPSELAILTSYIVVPQVLLCVMRLYFVCRSWQLEVLN